MPELPDLEVIKEVLNEEIAGLGLIAFEVREPLVFRCSLESCKNELPGTLLKRVDRRGKFLMLRFSGGHSLVVNSMLTGRYQLAKPKERLMPRTVFRMQFDRGKELRYFDSHRMGKIYLVRDDDYCGIPQMDELGPEPLDQSFTEEVFRTRLKRHRGMIKNVLRNQRFVAGIGNAYADEILFQAGLLPVRVCSTLTEAERHGLYRAMVETLKNAIVQIRGETRRDIHKEKRQFLSVHNRSGEPCPKCGSAISQITPNREITSFCRSCQH